LESVKVGVGHVVSQPLSSESRIFHHPQKVRIARILSL